MANDPLQSLTIRLALDDALSSEIRRASAVLIAEGKRMGVPIEDLARELEDLDKDGRKHLTGLVVGMQETAASVTASAAKIDDALGGIGSVGTGGPGLSQAAQGLTLLDAGATKLIGTLTSLAVAYVSVTKAAELLSSGIAASRSFDEAFKDLPVLLNLSAEAANNLRDSIESLAEARGLSQLEALGVVEEAIRNGAKTSGEAIDVALASLDLYAANLASAADATKIVTDALSAFGRGAESAAEFTELIGGTLLDTRDNAQQFAAGLDRIAPKAVRLGTDLRGLLVAYDQLRKDGLPLAASFANIERSIDQLAEADTRKYFAELGYDVNEAIARLGSLDRVLFELAARFGDDAQVISDMSARGVGLGVAIQTIRRASVDAAAGLDALTDAQKRFIAEAEKGLQSAATQAKRVDAAFENINANIGAALKGAYVGFFEFIQQAENGARGLQGLPKVDFVDGDADARIKAYIASADELTKSLGLALEAERKANDEFKSTEFFFTGPAPGRPIGASDLQQQRELDEKRQALASAQEIVAQLQAQIAERSAAEVAAKDAETAMLAARSATDDYAKSLIDAAAAQGKFLANVLDSAEAQASADKLFAQIRVRAAEDTERLILASRLEVDGMEAQIDALERGIAARKASGKLKGEELDRELAGIAELRTALRDLGVAEANRIKSAAAARAKLVADQRDGIARRVETFAGGDLSGIDAAFKKIEEAASSLTAEIAKGRAAQQALGEDAADSVAIYDQLAAQVAAAVEPLKDVERAKISDSFAASIREAEEAMRGLGAGLTQGFDSAFAQIEDQTEKVIADIREKQEAIRTAVGQDVKIAVDGQDAIAALDAVIARARLLGDALTFQAQVDGARDFLAVLADIRRQGQVGAIAGLDDDAREFGEAAVALRAAQSDAEFNILNDAKLQGLDAAQTKDLVDREVAALQREFDAHARELTLEYVLRPEIQIAEQDLQRQLEQRLAPFAKKIAEATEAQNASLDPATGLFDPEKVKAVEDALRDARVAAEEFNKEIFEGSAAFGKGFGAALSDRIKAVSNDFVLGAKLAGDAFDSLGSNLGDAFYSIVDGSKSASEAFKDFAKSFVADIARMISQALAFKLVAGTLGLIGGGGGEAASEAAGFTFAQGGVMPGQMQQPRAFADGGIMPGAMSILADGKRLPVHSYAHGGVATSPQMAIFAEKPGMAEAFVPLPGPDRGIPVEFKNTPRASADDERPPQTVMQNTVSVSFTVHAVDSKSVTELLAREARTIEDLVASAVSSGSNRALADSIRSAGNPARG